VSPGVHILPAANRLEEALQADDSRTVADAAAWMLWNTRPSDRALRGWNSWPVEDGEA
jgi:hypothetical protein